MFCRGPRSEAVAQDGYRGTLDSGDDAGRSMQNYPDNQQVFIGNLPRNLADKDLREFFESKKRSEPFVAHMCWKNNAAIMLELLVFTLAL